MNKKKLLAKAIAGSKNIPFDDIVTLVQAFGFVLMRINGSHHIFKHPNVPDLLNLQEHDGKAKPYQVRQFLDLVEMYDLKFTDDAPPKKDDEKKDDEKQSERDEA